MILFIFKDKTILYMILHRILNPLDFLFSLSSIWPLVLEMHFLQKISDRHLTPKGITGISCEMETKRCWKMGGWRDTKGQREWRITKKLIIFSPLGPQNPHIYHLRYMSTWNSHIFPIASYLSCFKYFLKSFLYDAIAKCDSKLTLPNTLGRKYWHW